MSKFISPVSKRDSRSLSHNVEVVQGARRGRFGDIRDEARLPLGLIVLGFKERLELIPVHVSVITGSHPLLDHRGTF